MLNRVLVSLHKQLSYPDEVIVIDAGSGAPSEKTMRVVKRYSPLSHQYHKLPGASASRARNMGILHSKGDILAFLDDDAVPERDWAVAVRKAVKVGPFWFRGLCADASDDTSLAHRFYEFDSELSADNFTRQWSSFGYWKGYQLVDLVQAGNFFVSRSTLEQIHPVFDETRFPFIAESIDLSLRIRREGHQILFVPKAAIRHYFLRLSYTNFVLYSSFWYGRALAIFHERSKRSVRTLGMFGRIASNTKRRKPSVFWKIIGEGYRLFRAKYSRSFVYDCAFLCTCVVYLLSYGTGYIYGEFEEFIRDHVYRVKSPT